MVIKNHELHGFRNNITINDDGSSNVINGNDNNIVINNGNDSSNESDIFVAIDRVTSWLVTLTSGETVSLYCDNVTPNFVIDIQNHTSYTHKIDSICANVLEYREFSESDIAAYNYPAGGKNTDYIYVTAEIKPEKGIQSTVIEEPSNSYISIDANSDTSFYIMPYFEKDGYYKVSFEFEFMDSGDRKVVQSEEMDFYYLQGNQISTIDGKGSPVYSFEKRKASFSEYDIDYIERIQGTWYLREENSQENYFTKVTIQKDSISYQFSDGTIRNAKISKVRQSPKGIYYVIEDNGEEYVFLDDYQNEEIVIFNSHYPDVAKYDSRNVLTRVESFNSSNITNYQEAVAFVLDGTWEQIGERSLESSPTTLSFSESNAIYNRNMKETVEPVNAMIETTYGLFIQMGHEKGTKYGYRWEYETQNTLSFVSTWNPDSMEGYSGSSSYQKISD